MTNDEKVALVERATIVPGEAGLGPWLAGLPGCWNKVCMSCDEAREFVWREFESLAKRRPALPVVRAAEEPQYRCLNRHEVIFPGDLIKGYEGDEGLDGPWYFVDSQAYFTPSEWSKMTDEYCVFRRSLA